MSDETIRFLPRIGMSDAMRLYGLTARAIRFYEEKGLVEAKRDRLNARFFDGEARGRLAWISLLREAGVSLPEIEEVLEAEEADRPARALASLGRRKAALSAEQGRLDATVERLADLSRIDAAGIRSGPRPRLLAPTAASLRSA